MAARACAREAAALLKDDGSKDDNLWPFLNAAVHDLADQTGADAETILADLFERPAAELHDLAFLLRALEIGEGVVTHRRGERNAH
jgi:hypothetical protein